MATVTRETQRFVKFWYPGSFFAEDDTKRIEEADDETEIPPGAFAYEFYSQDRITTAVDGEEFEKRSAPYNQTGKTFPGGKVYSMADLEALDGDHDTLIFNVKQLTGYAVLCNRGNWQPFDPSKDRVT